MIAFQNKLCWLSLEYVKNQWVHPNLQRSSVSFTYLFKFNYFCFVDVWTLKKNFVEENKKPFTAIKTTATHNNFTQIYIARKVAHAIRNSELLKIVHKAYTYMASMHKLKSMIFTNWLCHLITSINVVLTGIYLELWFSWLRVEVQKTSRKRLKQTEAKHR